MKFKFFSLLIFYISLTGCKNELSVPILEPLKPDVVKVLADKDSTFERHYVEIRLLVDSVYLRNSNKTLIEGLTYSDLFGFQNEFSDRFNGLKDDVHLKENWQKSYSKFYEQFVADSLKFSKYIKENSFYPYVAIEFIKAYEKDSWIGKQAVAEIKITPINGNVIRSIEGYLIFKPKGEPFHETFSLSLANAFFNERYPYTAPFVVEAGSQPASALSNFINLPKSIIDQKYDTYFQLSELIIEDRYVDVSLDSVPESFKRILESPQYYNADFYIKEELDSNYNSLSDLIRNKVMNDIKDRYSAEINFYEYGYKHLYNVD